MKNLKLVLSKFTFFLFLLLIPTQLGKHFWPDWASVQGVRVDYLSPTVYLLDIIFIFLLILNFKIKIKNSWKFLILSLVFLLNLISAWNKWETGYRWLKIMELGWVFFYIKENKEITKKFLRIIVPIWIVFESILGLVQVVFGSSVNGIFYWFGERAMYLNTLGVAKWSILGSEHLRAYGTFSHPNSMAGFMLVSVLLWIKSKPSPNPSLDPPSFFLKTTEGQAKGEVKNVFWWVVWWFGIMGIIICGSRTVWMVGLLILFYKLSKKSKFYLIGAPILAVIVFSKISLFSGWDPTSFKKRWDLTVSAVLMIKDSILLGVGAGNFLVRLPDYRTNSPIFWLQPVHNIYLLLVSELGILGIMALGWISEIKKINYLPLIAILLTGLVDHYWVTLPQNMWLMVLVFGLI